ncbi:MAG: hypothetical protein EAZ89_19010 [Bacteroidetes bacterium]|nr:MAG: hypothetical protein EAZ89_19010 [Bacteroidota bacterium]
MRAHYLQLFAYDAWANKRITDALLTQGVTDEKCLHWISHVYNAADIWLDRILTGKSHARVHHVYPLAEIPALQQALSEKYLSWLASLKAADFERVINYTTTTGDAFSTKNGEILTHVANHGTHHRAQISARLREMGIAPPPTDFIFFVR